MSYYTNSGNIYNFPSTQINATAGQDGITKPDSFNSTNNDMNWQHVSQNNGMSTVSPERNPAGSELDRDAFLRLLVTQLQFQDPLNPMDDTDFVAQLAQFSALEQMYNMNQNSIKTQAFSMIGKPVMAHVYNPQTHRVEEVVGFVEGVIVRNGEPFLAVGDREISMNDVVAAHGDPTLQLVGMINNQLLTAQNIDLIGQYAQFLQRDEEGEIDLFVEGKIDSLKFDEETGRIILVIGTTEVFANELKTVSTTPLLVGRVVTGNTSTNQLITGPVQDVNITNGRIQLVLDEGNIPINNITHVTDALRHVGSEVSHRRSPTETVSGVVESIRIRSGVPYFVLDNGEELSFLEFSGIEEDEDED